MAHIALFNAAIEATIASHIITIVAFFAEFRLEDMIAASERLASLALLFASPSNGHFFAVVGAPFGFIFAFIASFTVIEDAVAATPGESAIGLTAAIFPSSADGITIFIDQPLVASLAFIGLNDAVAAIRNIDATSLNEACRLI